ncbi:response regulator [Desulfocurvus vexinensis]|uniref:response regulator n=1 Tax=Desulfocurvus vexinensis TaxID=399548 RepID=UPI00048F1F80|nr:response regulator [Desulfocurvus vexinensis]
MTNDTPKLLLVDDEERFRTTLAKRLKESGFAVQTVGSGMDALALLAKEPCDAVVLDIRMPGLSGIETLAEIRKNHIGVEVILLTGDADVPSAIEGMRLGAFDYLMKPHDYDSLLEKLNQAVALKRQREERLRKAEERAQLDRLEKTIRF